MSPKFHGITSLGLFLLAVGIGTTAIFRASMPAGIAFMAICAVGGATVLFAYCAKCPAKAVCGHVLPGHLTRLFPPRPSGSYTRFELIATAIALLMIIGLPQLWLWRSVSLLAAFWLPVIVAGVQIRFFICRACGNRFCPGNCAARP